MPLPASLAVVCILFSLVPGWLYLEKIEKTRPPAHSGGLRELLHVLAVGMGTTGLAIVLVVLLPAGWPSFALDRSELEIHGLRYAQSNLRETVLTAVAILVLACVFAQLLFWIRTHKTPKTFRPLGDVWVHSLGDFPEGALLYVGVTATDGTLYEGILHSYTVNPDDPEVRDIALKNPIRLTGPETTTSKKIAINRLIIPASRISSISVQCLDRTGRPVAANS
ncbi:DUF6338 family protein [Rhodococcus qingshengii]|uniref:DUF6338 family protein n=1 Tax=Rhodococcus qingshengii TaxID=334542 RepID=UPI0010A5C320|nr:DUF6338 family protein [Rhodococcus qingshengii]THJ73965.1 hypothetical protein EU244_00405 [Rhodococcus qingshengii]